MEIEPYMKDFSASYFDRAGVSDKVCSSLKSCYDPLKCFPKGGNDPEMRFCEKIQGAE